MSSANVELVRSILEAWERGDFSSAEWADPEIELVIGDGPAPGSRKGLAGMAEAARDGLSAWKDFRFAVEEYRELADERVLALVRFSGRGKRSGLEVGQIWLQGAALFQSRDGRVTRLALYFDRERALADLGPESESGSP